MVKDRMLLGKKKECSPSSLLFKNSDGSSSQCNEEISAREKKVEVKRKGIYVGPEEIKWFSFACIKNTQDIYKNSPRTNK